MSGRNKVAVIVLLLALGLALSGWLLASRSIRAPAEGKAGPARLEEFRHTIERMVPGTSLPEAQLSLLALARKRWPSDPFLGRKPVAAGRRPEPPKPAAPDGPAYTGYVEVGDQRLAIIDGRQYEVGEDLESGDYRVVQIEPELAVLLHLADRQLVRVPFTGDVD